MMPDQTKPFQIECDASKYTSGAVLTQLDNNGDQHPIAFLSKTFNKMKRNYEIYDRELLAIIRVLEEWRHYIQGSGHTTIIHSDHQNLTFFRSAQKLNQQQAQWSLYLSEFDVKLLHQPGSKMIQSDALSQRPCYEQYFFFLSYSSYCALQNAWLILCYFLPFSMLLPPSFHLLLILTAVTYKLPGLLLAATSFLLLTVLFSDTI